MKKLLAFEGFLLLSGMVCGIIGYVALPDALAGELQAFLTGQMQNLAGACSTAEAAGRIARANALDVLRVYLAGICLLGGPIVIGLLFLKGFAFGFTGCFLAFHSVLLIAARIIYLPLFAAVAAIAVRFSWMMLQNRLQSPLRQLAEYTLVFALLLLLVLAASYIDGFFCARYLAGHAA